MKKLSHLDSHGRAKMVDVGQKPISTRRAVASAFVVLQPETLDLVGAGGLKKGDALAVSRLAGIQGAKLEPIRTVERELTRPDGTRVKVRVPVYPPFRLDEQKAGKHRRAANKKAS